LCATVETAGEANMATAGLKSATRGMSSRRAAVRGKAGAKVMTKAKATRAPQKTANPKTAPLSFRMDDRTRDLIDRAARVSGQNRTDFMLMALKDRATEVLLNQRLFALNESDWDAFASALDEPPAPNARLKALLSRAPIWDQ
jgi:uncharacterized protein (DUF1778 family)